MDFTTGEELAQLAERDTLNDSRGKTYRLMRNLGHSLGDPGGRGGSGR